MTLIKSISGIRGTIGGEQGKALTPIDISKFSLAFGKMVLDRGGKTVVIGRDARISGLMVQSLVTGNLMGIGLNVIDLGLSTTPTVEMAVVMEKADAGIIITASHNPKQWNALKLLNEKGEFISDIDGKAILEIAERNEYDFPEVDKLGSLTVITDYIEKHIQKILALPLVDVNAVKKKKYSIVVDAVNSVGGIAVPQLLKALGVETIYPLFCEPNGKFAHNPEPLEENLSALSNEVKQYKADMGIAVDPDVDRLVLMDENGVLFGEEYTLVAVSDYILMHKKGATVSNLSSTKALKDITEKAGCNYYTAAVGEVNVVAEMKKVAAVIGGEGNGGIIYPELHYGRDALVGIALFLTHLAKSGKNVSALRATYPNYFISKNKIEANDTINLDKIMEKIGDKYEKMEQNKIDGLKITFESGDWVHLRKSNTEPIIRIYAESNTIQTADTIANKVKQDLILLINEN